MRRGAEPLDRGRVIAVSRGSALVECEPGGRCGECTLCRAGDGTRPRLLCETRIEVSEGDEVLVLLEGSGTVRVAALLFLLPIACFVGGIAAAHWLAGASGESPAGEKALFGGGAIGLAAGLGIVALIGKRRRGKRRYRPVVVGRASSRGTHSPPRPHGAHT